MSDLVEITIRRPVSEKLQQLAVLTGDMSSVIERLIAHWEGSSPSGSASNAKASDPKPSAEVRCWHSPSGDVLRIGEPLQGSDDGKTHDAVVVATGIQYEGRIYDSPSAAARAVKEARGLTGASASTNGRDFWRLRDPQTNRWVPIKSLRPAHRKTAEEMLAELDVM